MYIGNSAAVAQEHYLQVTDAHFAKAVAESTKRKPSGKGAAKNQAQSAAATTGNDQDSTSATNENRPELPGDSDEYGSLLNIHMGAVGFEPTKA
jgi:hypothetical protein